MFEQFVDVALYAQKALNETISGLWTFSQPLTIDVTSGSFGLTIDNDGSGNPFLQFKSGATDYGKFQTILATPGFFSAAGGAVFFSTSNPASGTAAFTLYTDSTGSLGNVANIFTIQGNLGAFNWPILAQFAYGQSHLFTNHLTSGTSWIFNNNAVLSSGFLAQFQNSAVTVFSIDNIGNVVSLGNYTGVNQILSGYEDLANISAPSAPGANNLRNWVESVGGYSMPGARDSTGIVYKPYREMVQICHNGQGGGISKGEWVYIKGSNSSLPSVAKANASSLANLPAVGIALESFNDGTFGRVMFAGLATNLSTTGFSAGDKLYISTTPGVATKTEPSHPNYSQLLGICLFSHGSTGIIQVFPGRNLGHLLGTDSDDFQMGSGSGGAVQCTLYAGASRTMSLRSTPTGIRTVTVPDATGTIALLGLAQSFTAQQTFTQQIVSSVSTGTAPFSIASTTLVTNLNADLLDGKNTGTSGNTIPLLDGNNTWSGTNAFSAAVTGESANFHSPSSFAFFGDDFTGNGTNSGEYSWSTQTSGTGAAVANQVGAVNHPGIRRASTGTTTTGFAGWNTRLTYIAPNGGDYFQTILKLSANTGNILRVGLVDISTGADVTDGYYFEFDPSASANWRMCTAAGGTRTKTNSSSAVSAATWYNLELKVNSANTSVEFFVNGASIGTVTTNIPGNSNTTGMAIIIQNDGVSTTNVDCDVDLMYWYNKTLTR